MKKLLTHLALAAAAGLAAVPAQAEINFTFSTADSHVAIGESTTVNFFISGLDSEVLSAFDLNFTWSAGLLGLDTWTFAPGLAELGAGADLLADSPVAGNFGVQAYSVLSDTDLANSQSNSFLLGSFTVSGLADGKTSFTLGPDAVFDRNFVGLNFESLDVNVGSLCVSVGTGDCQTSPIPEPSSLALMLLGLGCVGVAARRRQRTTAA
jgi:PEP-CTERM motif